MQIGGWQNKYVANGLGLLIVGLLLFALIEWLWLPVGAMFTLGGISLLSFGRFIPFSEACPIVYDALRGTPIRPFIDNGFPLREQKLDVVAGFIAQTDVSLFGKEPAGAALVPFDKAIMPSGCFVNGGTAFGQYGNQPPLYTDLSLKRRHLRRAIAQIRALAAHA